MAAKDKPERVLKLSKPALLTDKHVLTAFDCGEETLNSFLQKRALAAIAARTANTVVVCRGKKVVGYFSLANGAVAHEITSAKVRQNTPDPIPATVLARLAVDKTEQGRKLGEELLQEAGKRALAGAKYSAARLLIVHALNARAVTFYQRYGFAFLKAADGAAENDEPKPMYIALETLAAALP